MIQKRDDLPEDDASTSPGESAEASAETAPIAAEQADEAEPAEGPEPPANRVAALARAAQEAEAGSEAADGQPDPDAATEPDADPVQASDAGEPDPADGPDSDPVADAPRGADAAADDDPADDGSDAEGREPSDDADVGAAHDDLGEPGDDGAGPDEAPCGRPLTHRVEAILFAAATPLPPAKLARVLDEPLDDVKAALEELVESWSAREGAVDLVAIAGGWRFMTRPEFQADLAGMAKKGKVEKLSPAALETLAIVAYKQPLTRAEVEGIRGVAAGPLLRVLLDRDLIRVSGRSPEPGHPLLYGTTKRFLDHFGLDSLRSLPDIKDLLDVS